MLYKCKYCKQKVERLQIKIPQVCKDCVLEHFESNKDKILQKAKTSVKRKEKAKTDAIKETLKTRTQKINDVKPIFQKYCRLRDADAPCISCGKHSKYYDGGHFFKAEVYSGVIFDENNVHKQCVNCNRDLYGNLIEYRINLIKKIGIDAVEQLEQKALKTREYKYSDDELKNIKEVYALKIKQLEK